MLTGYYQEAPVIIQLSPEKGKWIAKDIPSYGSQSERAKIAIHWFGLHIYQKSMVSARYCRRDNIGIKWLSGYTVK